MVKNEGWASKPGSKWKSMPEQMFRYRAAAFWQRMYAPEISMGFSTADEIEDIQTIDVVAEEINTEANKGATIGRKAPAPEPKPAPTEAEPEKAAPKTEAAKGAKPEMDF